MADGPLRATSAGLLLQVLVQPRASRSEVVGAHGDRLRVRLAAPPVDGAANTALIELLSERLGIPRSDVRIATGHTGRRKSVEVAGLAVAVAAERLGLGRPGPG